MKKGEPTVSAAARELFEELGLNATKVTRMRQCDFAGSKSLHKVCLIEAEGEPRIQGGELDAFLWWNMKEEVPCYPHVKHVLKTLLDVAL